MILAGAVGGLIIICMLACCCCRSSQKNKVEIIENCRVMETSPREVNIGGGYNQRPGAGNDTSVELEDIDDDEMGGHGESNSDTRQHGNQIIHDNYDEKK